jgi:hypothetical protein
MGRYMKQFLVTAITTLFFFNLSAEQNAVEVNYDFRYRYEYTDDESKAATRRRNRIRARLGVEYKPTEKLEIKIRLATAEEKSTSANQTLGHDFSLSDIGMDQFYFDYAIDQNSKLVFGKQPNPFFKSNKSQVIFDNDFNPEGMVYQFRKGMYFSTLGIFSYDKKPSESVSIDGFQIGLSNSFSDATSFKLALAQYKFDKIKGRPASEITWNGKIFGNPEDANGNYLNNFNVTNISAEIKTTIGTQSIPSLFFIDIVNNKDAKDHERGFQAGIKLNFNKLWKVTYLYKDVEKNAVFGALVDSTFGGGGSGHKGHQMTISYPLSKKLTFDFTWFDNKKKMEFDYQKALLDFKYKL